MSLIVLASCAHTNNHRYVPSAGDRYVAMGSSFAAGPGLAPEHEGKTDRCGRSTANYAHLTASTLKLDLIDVSCGGATTANVLGPWGSLPAQLDALTADVRLVTITIGGNDVGYIGSLMTASMCRPASTSCRPMTVADESAWEALELAMRNIVAEIRHRSPNARIIFVDYLTVLPEHGTCDALALTITQADTGRLIANRLGVVTTRVAVSEHVDLLQASIISREHDACSSEPWVSGAVPRQGKGTVPFHPDEAGMNAVADALVKLLLN